MKHLKHFKTFEAVIMPSDTEDNSVVNSFDSAVEFGQRNDFDVVDYETFYNSLGDEDKKTAPPKVGVPFFALFHPINNRPMFVISDSNILNFIPNFREVMVDIIGHEKVHAEQSKRRGGLVFKLPNPMDRKAYFSNKEEIMAFSYTIANGLCKYNTDIKSAMNDLLSNTQSQGRPPEYKIIWNDINKYCDGKVIKRYTKYIYMYLDKIFNKNKKES